MNLVDLNHQDPFLSILIPCLELNDISCRAIQSAITVKNTLSSYDLAVEVLVLFSRNILAHIPSEFDQAFFWHEPPSGIYPAFNSLIEKSQGYYLLILCSDDYIFSPSSLVSIALLLQSYKIKPDFAVSSMFIGAAISSAQLKLSRLSILNNLRSQKMNHPGMIISKNWYDNNGLYPTNLGPEADYAICLKLLKTKAVGINLNLPYVFHQLGGVSTSISKNRLKSHLRCLRILSIIYPSYYPLAFAMRFLAYSIGSLKRFVFK